MYSSNRDKRAEEEAPVQEGFICPYCRKDLASPQLLLAHFDEHKDEVKPSSTQQQRGLFGRGGGRNGEGGEQELVYSVIEWAPQELGKMRRHTSAFRQRRKKRSEHDEVVGFQLLGRLEKLLYEGPTPMLGKAGLKIRKEYEQTIVSWTDGSMVPLCPDCGQSFTVMRRRHHCRLCGSVLCEACSIMMPIDVAEKLVEKPKLGGTRSEGTDQAPLQEPLRRPLRITMDSLRICNHCDSVLLKHHQRQQLLKKGKSALLQNYEKMMTLVHEVSEEHPKLNDRIAFLVQNGRDVEEWRHLQEARAAFLKKIETIDSMSKKILAAHTPKQEEEANEDENKGEAEDGSSAKGKKGKKGKTAPPEAPKPKKPLKITCREKVGKNIRFFVAEFLQTMLVTLQKLPNQMEFEKQVLLRKQREIENQRRIEQERERTREREREREKERSREAAAHGEPTPPITISKATARGRRDLNNESPASSNSSSLSNTLATPTKHATPRTSDPEKAREMKDMLAEQRQTLMTYLKDAKKNKRKDEVVMLEAQLRTLDEFENEAV